MTISYVSTSYFTYIQNESKMMLDNLIRSHNRMDTPSETKDYELSYNKQFKCSEFNDLTEFDKFSHT